VTDVCCAAKPSGLVACPARALGQRRSSIFSLASGGHGPTLQTLHTMAHDAGMSGSAVVHVVGSQRLCNRALMRLDSQALHCQSLRALP